MQKRYLTVLAALILLVTGTIAYGESLPGKWKIVSKGVDGQNNPCPFIPDEIEFTQDGKVMMSNMPGMQMLYKTKLSPDEAKKVLARFPYVKDKNHALLMMPPGRSDWTQNAMAYYYAVKSNELIMEIPGWSPSRYIRSR